MKMFATVAALAAAAALGAPSSAFAQQTFGGTIFNVSDVGAPYGAAPYGALPPYEVVTIIRSMGFSPQSRPVLRGRVYVIHAIDNQGIPLRVAVDAGSGRVVRVVERMPGAGYGPLPPDRYGAYPVPPSAVPGGSTYDEAEDAAPDYRPPEYRPPANNAYPRPIYPQSSTQPPGAQAPRVASRTPPATPTPRARPQAAPATTSSIEDSGRPGKSVPAPVASRKVSEPPAEAPAAKPDEPKSSDLTLVPVAPLE